MHPSQIIQSQGESAFRDLETEIIGELSGKNGCIIATGGGAILRQENVEKLRMNGRIFFLDRPVEQLIPTEDRPLSSTKEAIMNRYRERYPIYLQTADLQVPNGGAPQEAAEFITRSFLL